MKEKSMRVLASDIASFTPVNAHGCQEIAMSTSSNAPARTMNDFRRAAFLGGTAVITHAALDAVRRQPVLHRGRRQQRRRRRASCGRSHGPCRRPGSGFGSATPASWLRPGSASYSPRMAMTGPPSPASPITAVGMPARFSRDAETLAAPASARARRRICIRCRQSPAFPRCGRSAPRTPAALSSTRRQICWVFCITVPRSQE